jgi:hypothetical protein
VDTKHTVKGLGFRVHTCKLQKIDKYDHILGQTCVLRKQLSCS